VFVIGSFFLRLTFFFSKEQIGGVHVVFAKDDMPQNDKQAHTLCGAVPTFESLNWLHL
jgi:hypothetical protein